ncbi:efflux transporter outer membrane subunit [Halocola ammonii]
MRLSPLSVLLTTCKDFSFAAPPSFRFCLLTALTAIFFLAGCSPKVKESALPLESPEKFTTTGNVQIQDRWWRSFEDEQLNEFVSSALDSNFNLLAAWERLEASEAVVRRERSVLFPEVEANVQSAISRPEPDFVGGENIQLGLRAFYEVDIWGRLRSAVDAERFRSEATMLDYRALAVSISAEITTVWYRLESARLELDLLKRQVENNEKILRLLRNRYGSGQIRGVDILRQQQLVESTRQQQYQLESRVAVLENQLALLLGRPPQLELDYQADSLPELPDLPNTGIPADLIERRPDVQASFSLLKAADREVASAISSQYPRLTINSNMSVRANDFSGLVEGWAYSLAGNLLAPIFYGGRLKAEVDRTESVKEQRLYEYGQTVLVAFREVEDALVQENKQKKSIEVLEEQVKLASQTSEQLRMQYFNGMSNYLDVLTAENEKQNLQRQLITAQQNLIEFRIGLYRALAGGVDLPREEEETE